MTHEGIPIEAKDAGAVHMLVGTIDKIHEEETRTADVDIDDHGIIEKIPIFYHCQKIEEGEEGGSEIATAGNPFIENDRVLIVNYGDAANLSAVDMKVIGFEDGLPRECGFQFKITRDDETLITEVGELLTYIKLYNSNDDLLPITVPKYNADTEYWSFNLTNRADADPGGYWAEYACKDGISTQYPYKYKDSDKREDDDLIKVGKYEADIPYWKVEFEYDPEPVKVSPLPFCIEDPFVIASDSPSRWWLTKTGFSMNKLVKSSVPFKIVYEVKSHYGVQRLGETCQPEAQAEYTAISDDGLLDFNFVFPVTPLCVESGWINGNIAGFDAKITITVTGFAEEYNCTQMWLARSYTRPWEIYVSYEDFDPLPC